MSRGGLTVVLFAVLLFAGMAPTQVPKPVPAKPPVRLEPVAETSLIMDGIAQTNFSGLEKLLKQKPTENEAWTFGRGQALLIAEAGNLLMIRPPKNQGEIAWMDHSRELRDSATALAKVVAARDYEGSRSALGDVAVACNRCHQTFRVPTRIVPFNKP